MKHTIYLNEKTNFIEFSKTLPNDDKPAKRMALNDYLDSIIKSNVFLQFGQKRENLYFNWLENLCRNLHP